MASEENSNIEPLDNEIKLTNSDSASDSEELKGDQENNWAYFLDIFAVWWFSFISGFIIMWFILRFIIYQDYFNKLNNTNKLDDSISSPNNVEYYLYLVGVPLLLAIIISGIYLKFIK